MARIVMEKNRSAVEVFAGRELQRYLRIITGCHVPLEGGEGFSFLVGLPVREGEFYQGLPQKSSDLIEEEILIQSNKDCLILSGGSGRAVLYAVYIFLERVCGVRWFFPDAEDEIVPHKSLDDVLTRIRDGVAIRELPSFSYRERMFLACQAHTEEREIHIEKMPDWIDWMTKIRMNVIWFHFRDPDIEIWRRIRALFPEIVRRGLRIGVGDHAYRYFLSPKKYFQDHPDWFSYLESNELTRLRLGCHHVQFCLSHEEARNTFIRNVIGYLKKNPELDFLSIWPNDVGGWCRCPRCIDAPQADLYLQLDNDLAEAMHREGLKTRLLHMVYSTHIIAPDIVQPSDKLDILFCTWGRDYNVSLIDPEALSRRESMERWVELCRGRNAIYLHEKYARTYGMGYHLQPVKALAGDMPFFKEAGIDGMQLHTGMMGWWTKGLHLYVLARLLWNSLSHIRRLISLIERKLRAVEQAR